MRVTISSDDTSHLAYQGIDIQRFLSLLANITTINGRPSPFKRVEVSTSWGLLIFRFFSPEGAVTRAMNVALLDLTKELVIKDDGTIVDRYEKITEELCKTALDTLNGKPILSSTPTHD